MTKWQSLRDSRSITLSRIAFFYRPPHLHSLSPAVSRPRRQALFQPPFCTTPPCRPSQDSPSRPRRPPLHPQALAYVAITPSLLHRAGLARHPRCSPQSKRRPNKRRCGPKMRSSIRIGEEELALLARSPPCTGRHPCPPSTIVVRPTGCSATPEARTDTLLPPSIWPETGGQSHPENIEQPHGHCRPCRG